MYQNVASFYSQEKANGYRWNGLVHYIEPKYDLDDIKFENLEMFLIKYISTEMWINSFKSMVSLI